MRKQNFQLNQMEEIDYLIQDIGLNEEEFLILGYLKGFNRKNLREWNKKGLMDFSVPAIMPVG